jgi:DNA-directed RNA polymerase subunit RPC12/RpoP
MKCGKKMAQLATKFVRCPYCGCRVLFKERAPVAKELPTD